ncbi:hypothetical protein Pmani_016165 [Petrolisthes manimaculis]|uniref:Uncharacterized protein n=1 Tax=Petrolisthes manimaculis TaxID=1843537 RepID=A0AAE1PSA1_9EUCA|nr:hypothetical protein Pmani_016165 [Petrolisthes manimaculis]
MTWEWVWVDEGVGGCNSSGGSDGVIDQGGEARRWVAAAAAVGYHGPGTSLTSPLSPGRPRCQHVVLPRRRLRPCHHQARPPF